MAVWARASGALRIVSDTFVIIIITVFIFVIFNIFISVRRRYCFYHHFVVITIKYLKISRCRYTCIHGEA